MPLHEFRSGNTADIGPSGAANRGAAPSVHYPRPCLQLRLRPSARRLLGRNRAFGRPFGSRRLHGGSETLGSGPLAGGRCVRLRCHQWQVFSWAV